MGTYPNSQFFANQPRHRVALVAGVEATRTRSTRLKAAAESVEAVRTSLVD